MTRSVTGTAETGRVKTAHADCGISVPRSPHKRLPRSTRQQLKKNINKSLLLVARHPETIVDQRRRHPNISDDFFLHLEQ